ncbi:MAG TPA: SRPBCC family protein [Caulobacteraceae bacterium]|jgi:hypothetical protein|nr:SRPBCC family protein [Caulobacteraceae bacterium]
MAVDVVTETLIERPRAVVAAFAADPNNVPKRYANIKSVEWKTPPPAQLGSRVGFVAEFLGRRLAYTYEFVQFDPPDRLVMRTAEGPFPMETSYVWDDAGAARTRMILRNRGEPRGFSAIVAPFMVAAMRQANRKDLALLKSVLEADV